jgi:hypothetical protein
MKSARLKGMVDLRAWMEKRMVCREYFVTISKTCWTFDAETNGWSHESDLCRLRVRLQATKDGWGQVLNAECPSPAVP